MPPSALFQLLRESSCRLLTVSTLLPLPPSTSAKLIPKKSHPRELWFAENFSGEGKIRAAVSVSLAQPKARDNTWRIGLYWFLTEHAPPADFLPFSELEQTIAKAFGEREVDVRAEYAYDKDRIVSFFKPIELGEQTQILDEIIGFTGIKRDPKGKTLYTMEVAISDKSIEQILSFRQTVRLERDMAIPLLETARKIALLAIKPKEGK